MLFIAGPAVARFGERAVAWACAAFAAVTVLPGLASSLPVLAGALVLTGAASGVLDVGINAQAAAIERASGRRLMPLAHGLYSTGVLAGAVAAGLARGAGAGREPILLAVAALIAGTALVLGRTGASHSLVQASSRGRIRSLGRGLLVIGALGAAAFVVEGGDRELERDLPRAPARRRAGGERPRPRGLRRVDGRRALPRAGCRPAVRPHAARGRRARGRVRLRRRRGGAVVPGRARRLRARRRRDLVERTGDLRRGGPASRRRRLGRDGHDARLPRLFIGPPLLGGLAQAASLRAAFAVLAVVAAAVAAAATRLRLDP